MVTRLSGSLAFGRQQQAATAGSGSHYEDTDRNAATLIPGPPSFHPSMQLRTMTPAVVQEKKSPRYLTFRSADLDGELSVDFHVDLRFLRALCTVSRPSSSHPPALLMPLIPAPPLSLCTACPCPLFAAFLP